jgi:hypothetical protein
MKLTHQPRLTTIWARSKYQYHVFERVVEAAVKHCIAILAAPEELPSTSITGTAGASLAMFFLRNSSVVSAGSASPRLLYRLE